MIDGMIMEVFFGFGCDFDFFCDEFGKFGIKVVDGVV